MKRLLFLLLVLAAPVFAADTKISALPDGSPAVATDIVPIARAGSNYYIPFSAIWTLPTGSQFLGTTTCTTPAYSFGGDTNAGLCITGANSLVVQTDTTVSVSSSHLGLTSTSASLVFNDASGGDGQFRLGDNFADITTNGAVTALFTPTTTTLGSAGTYDQIAFLTPVKGGAQAVGTFTTADLTAARTWTFPDASGTAALLPIDGGAAGDITDASVTADDLGADSVSSSELNATGVEAELEAVLDLNELQGQVGDAQIADAAVDGGTGGEIADNTITPADVDETADFSYAVLSGKQDRNNTAVNDDDCTGEQGLWWYDTTDSAFEWCNANSGVPAVLGAGSFSSPGAGIIVDTVGDGTLAARTLTPGDGIAIANPAGAAGNPTVSTDSATVPRYVTGTATPGGTCQAGRDFYIETDANKLWSCTSTDTWTDTTGAGATPTLAAVTAAGATTATLMTLDNGATSAGMIAFKEDSSNGTNAVTLSGAQSTADVTVTLPAVTGTLPIIIASGAVTWDNASIGSAACSSAQDGGTATGVATTDRIIWNPNGDPTAITGYVPLTAGGLYIWAYPTADHVNFKACNNTADAIDPGSIVLNWMVIR